MTPLIYAHRAGPGGRFPDNSLEALRASLELPVDGIEFDVQRSADGRYFVHHDPTLSDGLAIPSASSLDVRRRCLANGEPIPFLDEFLREMHRGSAFLDLKESCRADEVAERALGVLPPESLFFSSFHHRLIRDLRSLHPALRLGVTVERWPVDPSATVREAGADVLVVPISELDSFRSKAASRLGMEVWCWGVKDAAERNALSALGVSGLISEYPARLLQEPVVSAA